MSLSFDFAPWLCWAMPTIGSVIHFILPKGLGRARYAAVVLFSFIAWIMALLMIFSMPSHGYEELNGFWFSLPKGASVGIGILLDSLSVILANLVAFLSFLILVYSFKYMEGEPGENRYWFFMSLFIGGMLMLILANNFIFFFIGWKIVGLCSFGLIGHYYNDDRKYWIGGPPPYPFQKPSRCGLKALLVTTFGDVALLGGIIIIYLYSGTFNFVELYENAGVWLTKMAETPGILTITILLLLAGPFAKSAQFPFHEWLPEAMAGPTPVSALIHAATMVKAGVYLVARVLPIFYFAAWILNPGIQEAMVFFVVVATIGGFTAFLAGTQAMVALELKKALAYSTMSVIGYMMLSLGVAGMSPTALVEGYTSGIFHLINHGIFKAALFLCAGVLIHNSHSIYITEMNFSRKEMKFTWAFMWIASLALIGIPPLSGFWSKDGILLSCLESGQYALFVLAALTVAVTSFYTIRFMGIMFHKGHSEEKGHGGHAGEPSVIMLLPYGILAVLTVGIGLIGPWMKEALAELFSEQFHTIHIISTEHTVHASVSPIAEIIPIAASLTMIAIGAFPAYRAYISHKLKTSEILKRNELLRGLHVFLWNRWYIDAFFNRVFVSSVLASREPTAKYIEGGMDMALNVGIPRLFSSINSNIRKLQTGILSVNMLYILGFMIILIIAFMVLGVL
ncbi:MAG: NADH-quinone oxidoreductase subunit L [Candidatus Methanomethyliaceae archaeon]|nr:NADH-quinone oxidoreductase subunit L [Candidatus Methanomethyliaceae archaeon]